MYSGRTVKDRPKVSSFSPLGRHCLPAVAHRKRMVASGVAVRTRREKAKTRQNRQKVVKKPCAASIKSENSNYRPKVSSLGPWAALASPVRPPQADGRTGVASADQDPKAKADNFRMVTGVY